MRRETGSRRVYGVFVASLLIVCLTACSRREPSERIEWTTMGTVAAFQYRPWPENVDTTPEVAAASVRYTFSEIERLLNAHDPNSEIRRLASLSEREILARCDRSVSNCYATAFRLMHESGGAFNPRWRGTNTLDLGAIAKGFAVDAATHVSDDLPALIDLGGNLRSAGGTWTIGVAESDEVIQLTGGMACATSAEYYRGKHIRDGRTGQVVTNGVLSVTVIHPSSAMLADGLSTTLFVLGHGHGEHFLRRHYPEATAIWVMKEQVKEHGK